MAGANGHSSVNTGRFATSVGSANQCVIKFFEGMNFTGASTSYIDKPASPIKHGVSFVEWDRIASAEVNP